MANQVALSQAEVDKLLGIKTGSAEPKVEKKQYTVQNFLSEKQIAEIREVCKSVYKHYKLALRKKFGEPKIRKLTISSLEEQNIDEFFDSTSENDFLYEIHFGKADKAKKNLAYVKLDSFLFGALSGMAIDTKHKINFFQSEVLKEFVVTFLAESFARQFDEIIAIKVLSLFEQDKKPFQTGETGLCITINWNENLRSFGIEKIFLTKELATQFRAVSA